MQSKQSNYIVLGKIGAPHGIEGYNRIHSYSEPIDQILDYTPWVIRAQNSELKTFKVGASKVHHQGLIAKLEGITDRNAAQLLTGSEILIEREQLPELPEGEYYWQDLEGLTVETLSGVVLGQVQYLYRNTGETNMVVSMEGKKEQHIPFIEPDFVHKIDFKAKKIIVDWEII